MTTARLLLATALACAGGCYAPDVRDCTITCTNPDDCAGDQTCNSDGRCTAEGVTCNGSGSNMGMVDAAQLATLKVQVMGTGKVIVDGVGSCDDDCTWQISPRALRFTAMVTDDEKPFERWTTQNCAAQMMPTCTYTPVMSSTTVAAKFK